MPQKGKKPTGSLAGGCYSRRLEEAFSEDYPKEGIHAKNKKNSSLSPETNPQTPGAGEGDSSAEARGLGPDAQGGAGDGQ